MDDRFDWQLVTNEFLDGEGLSYIGDTYRAFRQHRHPYNKRQHLHRQLRPFLPARLPGYSSALCRSRPGRHSRPPAITCPWLPTTNFPR